MPKLRHFSALIISVFSVGVSYAQTAPVLPTILSTTDLKAATQRSDIFERDGGFDFHVNGTTFWVFDDSGTGTVTATGVPSSTFNFIPNSVSATTQTSGVNGVDLSLDFTSGTGRDGLPALAQFIPYSPDENTYNTQHLYYACTASSYCGSGYAIWPWGATYDPATKQVIVSFSSFLRGGGVPSGQEEHGISLGTMGDGAFPTMTRPVQSTDPSRPTLIWSATDIPFAGSAFVENGYYYQYGETSTKDPNCNPYWCVNDYHEHIARVKMVDILDRSSWTFYSTDGTWSSSQANLADVFVSQASNFASIYYNHYLKEWMAVYLKQLDNHAYFRVATKAEGPWSAEGLLFTGELPTATSGTNLDYALRADPSLSPDKGKTMFFHYSRDINVDGYTAVQGQDLPVEEVIFAKP